MPTSSNRRLKRKRHAPAVNRMLLFLLIGGLAALTVAVSLPSNQIPTAEAEPQSTAASLSSRDPASHDAPSDNIETSSMPASASSQEQNSSSQLSSSEKAEDIQAESAGVSSEATSAPSAPPPGDPYPNLYCTPPAESVVANKTIYLTFDDGPSQRTAEVLDILAQKNVKATFFVVGQDNDASRELMRRIVREGHTLGIHTYTHDFNQIYASKEAYLADFNRIYTLVQDATGISPTIFRFPGGSVNGYNGAVRKDIAQEMLRRGFRFYDWNLSTGDADRNGVPAQECVNNVLNYSAGFNQGIVLLHDSQPKTTTVEALPAIIDGLRAQGFCFAPLTNEVQPITFPYDT